MGDSFRQQGFLELTFPNYHHTPPLCLQLPPYILVPLLIPLHLRHPEFSVGFGDSVILATLMSMPETAMNKDDCFVFWKNNVGRTRKTLIIYPVSSQACQSPSTRPPRELSNGRHFCFRFQISHSRGVQPASSARRQMNKRHVCSSSASCCTLRLPSGY